MRGEEKEPAAAAGLPPEFIKGLVRQNILI
jgi:hypothetical protein